LPQYRPDRARRRAARATEDGMKIKRIEHIAIAVEDLDAMAGMLRDKFGIAVEYNEEIARSRTRLAMLPVGESYIELLQGMAPTSRAAEWVAQKGQSLFHICFEVEDIDAALAELKAKGTKLLNETPILGHGNCRIAFVDPRETGNILFELAEMPKDGHGDGAATTAP
jgi:methylmalonyl-CoA/ethylmalonyl-CoA epimerase